MDWSDVLLKIATPAVITFGLGFGLAYMLLKDNGPTIQTYTEAKASEIYRHKICLRKLLT